jgi:hypothetical protein|tara:strand:+ start:75 stop:767 length:693 start_codon:yes stop_codon:yes gene_type:complete
MSADLFNSLLKESLNECNVKVDSTIETTKTMPSDTDIPVCLITGEPLVDKYITLACNHRFNYIPLTNERRQWIGNYKNGSYCYEEKISKNQQMVCPYCRSVTNGILPWFSEVNGVKTVKTNWVNWPKKHWYLRNKCLYKFSSGKRKGECCGKGSYNLFCSSHERFKDRYDEKGNLLVKPKKVKTNVFSCMHILSRGKRKGCCCCRNARARTQQSTGLILYHCSNHYKYYM